jgi:hypothetical protein
LMSFENISLGFLPQIPGLAKFKRQINHLK